MDAALLLKKFALTDPPGMSLSDPRFSEMATLIQNGDYPKATASGSIHYFRRYF